VLSALGFSIPVAGAVKDDKHRTRAILMDGVETDLKQRRQLYAYVGTIQEEVHRFAIEYHRKLRGKALSRSVLDSIPGIGEKRKLALLNEFGSIDAIKEADVATLAKAPGMNEAAAEAVAEYFSRSGGASSNPDPE
ncbi:MAG: excinuclease ABC subunit UvrC, partial [Firmicutes bacterium]|nr:excinuclease ABC subunit UvrC [Bacillota bacterium]